MKNPLFSVFDTKTQSWAPPFQARTHAAAARSFALVLVDEKNEMSRSAADYSLLHVGYWDDDSGVVEPERAQIVITGDVARRDMLAQIDKLA